MLNQSRNLVLVAALVQLTATLALAQGGPVRRRMPGGQPNAVADTRTISLPYQFSDQAGRDWFIRPDGTNGANAQPSDGNGRLSCNSIDFPDCNEAALNETLNELTVGPMNVGDVKITRHMRIDARRGWCRQLDEFENTTDHPITIQVDLYHKLAGSKRSSKVVDRDAGGSPRRILLEDGDVTVGLVSGGRLSDVPMTFELKDAALGGTEHYGKINVPARQSAIVINMHIRRAKTQEVVDILDKLGDEAVLEGLSEEEIKRVANFTGGPAGAVPRGNQLDVLETRDGARFSGTAQLEAHAPSTQPPTQPADAHGFTIETLYGPVVIPTAQVVSMIAIGDAHLRHMVFTRGGEAFSGRLTAGKVALELPNGQVIHVPLAQVATLGFRLAPGERVTTAPATAVNAKQPATQIVGSSIAFVPFVKLRSGDTLHIRPPTAEMPLATRYGPLRVPISAVRGILFHNDDGNAHDFYAVTLADGSSFGALLTVDELPFHLIGAAGERDITLPVSLLARLQLSPLPEKGDDKAGTLASGATLRLANDDVFAATLSGRITLDSDLQPRVIEAAQIAELSCKDDSPQTVHVTLRDGKSLSGNMQETSVTYSLAVGGTLNVPEVFLRQYKQPQDSLQQH